MASDPRFETIAHDHPISVIANTLSDRAEELAADYRISKWDVAVAYANAAAQILADSKDMPREKALERIAGLQEVMRSTYDLRTVEGEA